MGDKFRHLLAKVTKQPVCPFACLTKAPSEIADLMLHTLNRPESPNFKPHVLVTGAAGFIGSSVARLFAHQGMNVLGIDRADGRHASRLKDWRLELLRQCPGFAYQNLDIVDRVAVAELFSKKHFDVVINLAARAGVRQSMADPWSYYETNVIGTLNLLEQCEPTGVRHFVQASTSSVYGNAERPFSEDSNADHPVSPYAASKKAAEDLTHSYCYLGRTNVTVLRLFTVYGPAGRTDMSMFRFIRWIAEGNEVLLYGDGRQRRDFTFVEDVAEAFSAAVRMNGGFQVFNIGADRPVEIRWVIEQIQSRLGTKAKVINLEPDPLDVRETWADISKARSILGWEPGISIQEGIHRSVDWYTKNRSWAKSLAL